MEEEEKEDGITSTSLSSSLANNDVTTRAVPQRQINDEDQALVVDKDTDCDDNDNDDDSKDDDWVLLLRCSTDTHPSCKVVGIRYYRGVIHAGEFATLQREPDNPYDRNAIRVENMGKEKVGHIKRELAYQLAKLLDNRPVMECLQIDATIPGRGNAYTLPLELKVFGKSNHKFRLDSLQQTVDRLLGQFARGRNQKQTLPTPPPSVHVRTYQGWKHEQERFNKLFEAHSKEHLAKLPDVPIPSALQTPLLEHQVQGLRWLVHREREAIVRTETTSPPIKSSMTNESRKGKTKTNKNTNQHASRPLFYKQVQENGRTVWYCEITNSSQTECPTHVRGGILADDMGVGKTLQTIALILANPPPQIEKSVMKGAFKTTLVVAPVSVIVAWQEQIQQHVQDGALRVATYQGPNRKDILQRLDEIDILIVSYNTLQTDYRKDSVPDTEPPAKRIKAGDNLFCTMFHRIILDEAHVVRNTKSSTFKACMALQTERRLCLTGTPLQNKPEDIQALFQFLHVPPLSNPAVFRRAISQPIKDGDENGLTRLRATMACFALRRNKDLATLSLPDKHVEIRSVEFRGKHKEIYDTIFDSAKQAFQAVLKGGDDGLLRHTNVFEILTRLRQACCSGALVPIERLQRAEDVLQLIRGKENLSAQEGQKLLEKLKGALEYDEDASPECAICMEEMQEQAATILRTCSHVFCKMCLEKVAFNYKSDCPLCRVPFTTEQMIPWKAAAAAAATTDNFEKASLSQQLDSLGPSPKVEALLLCVKEMKIDEKMVIFSQFTKFLNEIEGVLTEQFGRSSWVRIDGTKSAGERKQAMKCFGGEDGPRFMLCSLRSAGTGITLSRANVCVMMDTWWNKAVEQQAQDRVHRIGQSRPVRIVRFVASDSVESRMIELQEAKAAMGKGAFEKLSPEEKKKARLDDVKKLLDLEG